MQRPVGILTRLSGRESQVFRFREDTAKDHILHHLPLEIRTIPDNFFSSRAGGSSRWSLFLFWLSLSVSEIFPIAQFVSSVGRFLLHWPHPPSFLPPSLSFRWTGSCRLSLGVSEWITRSLNSKFRSRTPFLLKGESTYIHALNTENVTIPSLQGSCHPSQFRLSCDSRKHMWL